MTSTSVHRRRALGVRLAVPLIIALGALPLMAPTCGSSGEGVKVFSRRSLVIPMDVCFQYMTDGVRTSYTPSGGATACPAVAPGDVIKAYGLVYQLIRNGIAVYWVINNQKTAVDGVDFSIQYQGGFPVFLYDWSTGVEGAAPTGSLSGDKHTAYYRGGPFVVDGSDFARASAVLQNFRSTFGSVNVHVSNVSFLGYAKRTMAGGWSAGGAVPPKLALLDIGSSGAGAKNSEVVIQGYLTRAGLDTPGAAGTSSPGAHGEIYDRLFMADFVPTVAGGDWTRTSLAQNGYQILWVPHWTAPSSCSDCPPGTSCTCSVQYDPATIAASLQTIGSFSAKQNPFTGNRGDVFAECAGLGSFEGVFSSSDPSTASYSSVYVLGSEMATGGEPSTHFETQSTTGVWINRSVGSAALNPAFFTSPLMQLGDYPFIPRTGAIQNFKPFQYKPEVSTLISEATAPGYDIFTLVPATLPASTTQHGTIVYLGGHSYSGTDGSFEVAGSRLVLNTLFNLGATCTATGVPCQTGLPGVCATGHYVCQAGQAVCVADIQPGQLPEICNGLDDNCNGQVDEGLQTDCYAPPAGYVDPLGRTGTDFAATKSLGVCRPGISVCQHNPDGSYGMSTCTGQVLPSAETCNGLDDDCNGVVDDHIAPVACYDGPATTLNVGICRGGAETCVAGQFGSYDPAQATSVFVPGRCGGEVLPKPAEICGNGLDDNCNGLVDEGCGCAPGAVQSCFSGPGTAGVGTCKAGNQTCQAGGFWGACATQVVATPTEACVPRDAWTTSGCGALPLNAACQAYDTNCDGRVTECPECSLGQSRACPDSALPALPAGSSWDLGQCSRGTQQCTTNGTWGACTGYIQPAMNPEGSAPIEYCDGVDNNCNGVVDDNAICPVGDTCLRGVCVPTFCGVERPPPEGYACSAGVDPSGLHTVVSSSCGTLPTPGCAVGQVCQYGNCTNPCPVTVDPVTLQTTSAVCGQGTVCGGGACIGGGCYETHGCLPSLTGQPQLCQKGVCVPDLCSGKLCPSGTFCRQGDCVQACTFVTCQVGERCGIDGFCVPDACAGKLCAAGQKCTNGACAADPCLGKGCANGQICVAQGTTPVCVDDPCNGVSCPAGACAGGQCYRSENLTGAGTVSGAAASSSKSGCGCGAGGSAGGLALPALLGLLAVPLARRRRRAAPGGRGALLLVLVSIALVASACTSKKSEAQFDPTTCAVTCGEQRCVDLRSDPGHCGTCGHACNAGEQCVDAICGPSSFVAPYVASVAPATGAKDAAVTVTLSGARFQQNATVRVTVGSTLSRTLSCPATAGGACQWLSSGALAARLDLTGAVPGVPWTLRVVNPDGVISNATGFGVVIPTPALAGVVPSTVQAGASTVLVVSGTGFTTGSRCHLSGPGVADLSLATTPTGGVAQLDCILDASTLAPGAYTLTVVSEPDAGGATHASNTLAVTVSPSDPIIYSVDPTAAATVAAFRITGARFDLPTARVLFFQGTPAALPTANVTVVDAGTILVHDLQVGGSSSFPNGIYTVQVRNGDGVTSTYRSSNAVSFSVGGAALPTITSFAPSVAYQGDPTVVLVFSGSNIPASPAPQIELEPPGSTTFAPLLPTSLACSGTSCTVQASTSLVGKPEGQWYARVRFGSASTDPTSAPWSLRVLSNQAILRDYAASPAPAQGGAVGDVKSSLVFTVSNIRGPDFTKVMVAFTDPTGASTITLKPSPDPTAATTQLVIPGPSALNLGGLSTGTWSFRVLNPNAQPSNALPFALNPGLPTLSTVCVLGAGCTSFAMQSDTPVTIRLTGTNFAPPDANGNGSVVMAAADLSPAALPGWPAPDPCNVVTTSGTQFQKVPGTATVVSPTEIDVQVDTRTAFVDPSYGTTYYVGVWNPGGVSGLQKSSCGQVPTKLPWFRLCATAACAQ